MKFKINNNLLNFDILTKVHFNEYKIQKFNSANGSNLIFNINTERVKLSKKVNQQQSQSKSFNSISTLESLPFKKRNFSKFLEEECSIIATIHSNQLQNDSSADSKIKLIQKSKELY